MHLRLLVYTCTCGITCSKVYKLCFGPLVHRFSWQAKEAANISDSVNINLGFEPRVLIYPWKAQIY